MEIKEFNGEVWRPVKDYEGLYEVSNFGRVRSLNRTYWNSHNCSFTTKKGRILKGSISRGYMGVILCYKGKTKRKPIHRLVAEAFIPVPEHLKHIPVNDLQVNHMYENKLDNRVESLEWCTRVYNINYGTGIKRRAVKRSKKVQQFTLDNVYIATYESQQIASKRTDINQRNISTCCCGKRKTAGGYIWKYAE